MENEGSSEDRFDFNTFSLNLEPRGNILFLNQNQWWTITTHFQNLIQNELQTAGAFLNRAKIRQNLKSKLRPKVCLKSTQLSKLGDRDNIWIFQIWKESKSIASKFSFLHINTFMLPSYKDHNSWVIFYSNFVGHENNPNYLHPCKWGRHP